MMIIIILFTVEVWVGKSRSESIPEKWEELFQTCNVSSAVDVACDIPELVQTFLFEIRVIQTVKV